MKTIQRNASDAEIFGRMMNTAQHGTFDGLVQEGGGLPPYLDECRWWIERLDCLAILTRDVGYHTSGWWILSPPTERGDGIKAGGISTTANPAYAAPLRKKGSKVRGTIYGRGQALRRVPLPSVLRPRMAAAETPWRGLYTRVYRSGVEELFRDTSIINILMIKAI